MRWRSSRSGNQGCVQGMGWTLKHNFWPNCLDTAEEPSLPRHFLPLSPQGCTTGMFFETRKHKDLYVWLGKTPAGPTAKFHVTNGEWDAWRAGWDCCFACPTSADRESVSQGSAAISLTADLPAGAARTLCSLWHHGVAGFGTHHPSTPLHLCPSAVHTMAELKLSGNHLKGSRPVLSFDATFDQEPHLQVLKEMLTQTFAVPRRHHKVKPFFDHVMSFTVADGRIWIRNYQVLPNPEKKKAAPGDVTLVEVRVIVGANQ